MGLFSLHNLLIIILYLTSRADAKWNYTFTLHLSDSWFEIYGDGSYDSMYWRLCSDNQCGVFVHSIWNEAGSTYSHIYTTPNYMGAITRIDIAHTGDDMLGIDWIEADGTVYEPGGITGVWSVEYTGGSSVGCDTTTITADNTWIHGEYDDCTFNDHFHQTYEPTPMPTADPVEQSGMVTTETVATESSDSIFDLSQHHQLLVKEHAINELTHHFDAEIKEAVLGTEIQGENGTSMGLGAEWFSTSTSNVTSINWDNCTITLDAEDQMVYISMENVTGTISPMNIEAGFICFATANPQFINWDMKFGARLFVENGSDSLGLEFDIDSVVIEHDVLNINAQWTSDFCSAAYWIFDVLLDIQQIIVESFVGKMPQKVVNTLNKELHQILPKSESVDFNILGLGQETMYILYQNVTLHSDAVSIGFDLSFDNDSFTDFEVEMDALFVQNFEIAASNLTELALFALFGFTASLFGCGYRYWLWRRKNSDDKIEIQPTSSLDSAIDISEDEGPELPEEMYMDDTRDSADEMYMEAHRETLR